MVLWFYVQELPKAQPAIVLVLKRLRRRGNSLKSHPTDWEKPGIEPATPGLQDIGLSPTPRPLSLSYSRDQYNQTEHYRNEISFFLVFIDVLTKFVSDSPEFTHR